MWEFEAWLMTQEFGPKGYGLDLAQPEHQTKLIAHLYQKLVRYTELNVLNVRNTVRLDHAPGGDESQVHPLAIS